MEEAVVSLRALVRGLVQEVGFREFVYTRARFLGITGYVRNLPDGQALEVVAEGRRENLEQLLEYLREGPSSARVDGVEAKWGVANGRYFDFGVAS